MLDFKYSADSYLKEDSLFASKTASMLGVSFLGLSKLENVKLEFPNFLYW